MGASITLTNSSFQTFEFDFPSAVTLIPGNVYTFRLTLAGGISYSPDLSTANPYANGIAYNAGSLPLANSDLVFAEGLSIVPEPSTLAFCGVGVVALWWRRKNLASRCNFR